MRVSESSGPPTMLGDVHVRQLEPLVAPSFDFAAEPFVRAVEPEPVPTLATTDVEIRTVEPPESTLADIPPTINQI